MKLSIVIPCYNEQDNLPLLLESVSNECNRDDVEIVVVNNGSTDKSAEVLEQLLPHHPKVRVVTVPVNKGYGYGILSGLNQATGEYIGWMHGDLQTPFKDVMSALRLIEENGSSNEIYVKGKRLGRSIFDTFFTVGMSLFETLLLRTKLFDINAQPNIFHRSFFESWDNPPRDFSLDLFAYYKAQKQKLTILRIPVRFPERIHGQSHWNTSVLAKWKFIKRTVDFSLTLRKRL